MNDFPTLHWRRREGGAASTALAVKLGVPLDDDAAQMIEASLDVFCRVGELGGFCERGVVAGRVACRKVASRRLPGGMQFELECLGLDHRCFQVLRNMLARHRGEGLDVVDIAVAGPLPFPREAAAAPLIDDGNEEDAYPPVHAAAGLVFAGDEDVLQSWLRRCVVQLRHPVEQVHIDALRALANPWFDLIEAGGFALPLDDPVHVDSVADTVAQFEECSAEITVLRFQASEEAWSTLANLVHLNAAALGLGVQALVVDG